MNKKIFYVINVDWFFLSHRLELALAAKKSGYDVFILAKDTGRKSEIEGYGLKFINIDFERSGKNPLKEIALIYKLASLYRKLRPIIVHHVTIKPSIYGSIAKRLSIRADIKVVNAISGLGYNFIEGRDGIVQKILKRLMRFAFSNLNFIFQNPDDAKLYRKMGFLEHNDFRLIKGAGVDSEVFSFHPPTTKEKLNITLTARMLFDKGISEFIEAANLLEEKWKGKVIFNLVGDIDLANPAGISENELKSKMKRGYLEWKGHKKEIQPILIDADIVCLPSYREGLPKSLIEAMATGRPIITTNVPGCRECVDDGKNGFLVEVKKVEPLSNAIEKLIYDEELRLEMGKASRKKMLAELSLTKVIDKTLGYYTEILNRR